MAFYKDEKLALFIDGANLYSAARGLGLEIDFRKLLEEFRKLDGRLSALEVHKPAASASAAMIERA